MKINTQYFAVIGILLFIYLLSKTEITLILEALKDAELTYITLALIIAVTVVILKTLKWKYIMKAHNINASFTETLKVWLIGSFVGSITPARAGEIVKVYYLKGKSQSGTILSTIALDRISDIISLFMLSIIGISLLLLLFNINMASIAGIIIIATIVAYLFTKESIARKIAKPLYIHFVPESRKNNLKLSYENFYKSIENFKKQKKVLIITLTASTIIWLLGILQAYFLTRSLGLYISYTYLLSIIPIFMLTTVLPITIAGIGTREATFIFFFSIIGIPQDRAISYSLLELGFILILTLTGGIVWIKEKKKISL